MLYLAIKALVSGVIIAVVSEIAKRSPGIGALILSLPLISILAFIWLWRDTGDREGIAALAQSVQALHAATLPHIFKPAGPDVYPATAVRASIDQSDHFLHVAVDGQRVVGYVQAEVQREPETALKYSAESVYIRQMGVDTAYQHRGIGRQLLDAVRRDVADCGITTIALTVYAVNDVAREFYLGYGFVPYREDLRLD